MAKDNPKMKSEERFRFKINNEININGKVRLIEDGEEQLVVSMAEARKIADERELDLMLVTDKSDMPVVRLCDYEKFIYSMKKKAKQNKQQSKPVKEITLSVNIADHDLETKANAARKFIESGHKVKAVLKMRGRELTRRDENKKSLLKFIVMLEDVAVPEGQLKDEGNKTIVYLKKK